MGVGFLTLWIESLELEMGGPFLTGELELYIILIETVPTVR